MSFLLLLLVFCSLPVFEVSVDPDFLEELYSEPFSDREIPAVVEFESISGSCTLAFRGGSSLWCDKKSWHIRIDNSQLFRFGKHILLNAQFRDASLMRNSLGLYLTRRLGYPAPQTEFCTLSINGENRGVYERVEAIDRLFYERNGLL
ncbi:MAG: CotH kinase family protein, partial [Candidatus Fermentibacteraceae bacterium]|nr:CotH kinase family protein [Candidatus Fermentibacteraceae bacterium]